MHILENEYLSVAVNREGAEICSIKRKTDGKEYVWQGNPAFWKRHAPVLFPVIGALSPGRETGLSKHGFARDMTFECVDSQSQRLVMALVSSEETQAVYPYDFILRIIYTLSDHKVTTTYEIENRGAKTMPFSIGGHPAFNCNLDSGRVRVVFESEEMLSTRLIDLKTGLLNGARMACKADGGILGLKPEIFDIDTLIYDNLKSTWVRLEDETTGTHLKVDFDGFPYLGIWSPKAPFVCIEPWQGLADSLGDSGDLFSKEGMVHLNAGAEHICSFGIEVLK